jgi:ketosteroid isomerase-like protein
VSQESVELVLRGYHAFIAGDFEAVAELLHPEIEWFPMEAGPHDFIEREAALAAVAERYLEGYHVELERAVGRGDQVVVSFRASRAAPDASDPRPLQTRRRFTVERYSAVIDLREGRVVRVRDFPHLAGALEAVGIDEHA